jgi:hypothetical protein
MKNPPLIFCHYGVSNYLPYVFQCAKIANPNRRVILLGDNSNKEVAEKNGIEHFLLDEYDFGEDLDVFTKNYELITSPSFDSFKHGKDWNEFVFRKWFILYNFLVKNNIEEFWHFDSDVMIFCDFAKFENIFRKMDLDCTEQCCGHCMKGYFKNPQIIDRYVKKINEVYLRKDYIKSLKDEYLTKKVPACFSEMSVHEIFQKEDDFKRLHIGKIEENYSFDDLICRSCGLEMEKLPLGHDVKVVHLNEDGRFFAINKKTKEPVEMQVLNYSWIPPYVFEQTLAHFKENKHKENCEFNANSKTLKDLKVPFYLKFKHYKKTISRKIRGKKLV